ncbi:MAG: hydrogenase maturation protease [Chthonomonadales bacterium]
MRVVVIGVGSEGRGDDAAGLIAAMALRRLMGDAEIHTSSGDPTDLMALWEGADAAILVDAAMSGAEPGTVHRFVPTDEPLPAELACRPSTHALGVPQAIELGRALGALPPRLVVYAIEARSMQPEAPLSPQVAEACERAAQQIAAEVRSLTAKRGEAARGRAGADPTRYWPPGR